jgi:hypothetical protein
MRKSRLSLALGIALGATAMIPATSMAFAPDLDDQQLRTDDSGDTLLFPLYTTAAGATTSFMVTNTSPTQTIAAKVRFREQRYSLEVMDFIVILSPNDKFDFWVSKAASQARPSVSWRDNSCVVGHPNETLDVKTLPFPAQPGVNSATTFRPGVPDDDMAVGHVEVIGMMNLENVETSGGADLDDAALHNTAGFPTNCNTLRNAFQTRANVNGFRREATAAPFELTDPKIAEIQDAGDVLIGSYLVTNAAMGLEAGGNPIALKDSMSRAFLAAQSSQLCMRDPGSVGDMANQGLDRCISLYDWDRTEQDHPNLADINWVIDPNARVAVLDNLTQADAIQGEWSNNPVNHVGFDWILTFPTKYVYSDFISDKPPAADSGLWVRVNKGQNCGYGDVKTVDQSCNQFLDTDGRGRATPWGTTVKGSAGNSELCLYSDPTQPYMDIWNVEEGTTTTESPDPTLVSVLCNEVSIFTFAQAGTTVRPSQIQDAALRGTVAGGVGVVAFDASLNGVRGWAELPLNWSESETQFEPFPGAAVHSLNFTMRATDDPAFNNSSIRENARHTPVGDDD